MNYVSVPLTVNCKELLPCELDECLSDCVRRTAAIKKLKSNNIKLKPADYQWIN